MENGDEAHSNTLFKRLLDILTIYGNQGMSKEGEKNSFSPGSVDSSQPSAQI